jgi:hypothetical protein
MRPQDIKIGETYRLHDHNNYAYAKAISILKPREYPNMHKYFIVKCEYTVNKNDVFGFIKYFRPCDLEKDKK